MGTVWNSWQTQWSGVSVSRQHLVQEIEGQDGGTTFLI